MKITQATCGSAPIVLLYGSEGRGKTSLAAKFPKPVAMLLERGLPAGVKLDAIDGLGAFGAVLDSIRSLYADPHGYQTLTIDTLDSLEPLLLEHVCTEHGWKNIESPPYGKGFVIADQQWMRFIRGITALRDKHQMTIVFACTCGNHKDRRPARTELHPIRAKTSQTRPRSRSRRSRCNRLPGRRLENLD